MKKLVSCCVAIIVLGLSFACGPPPYEETNVYKMERRFPCPEGFESTSAWVALEWNGRPIEFKGNQYGYGSGFLADKNKGLFYSNKHVTDLFGSLGGDGHKIFFNCRVYNATVARVAPLADAAVFRITGSFNPDEFPDPDPVAREKVKIGDRVFVEGYHPHPYEIRQANKNRGINYPLLPIYKDYYRFVGESAKIYKEMVYETFEGTITELNTEAEPESDDPSYIRELKRKNILYHTIKTDKEHLFSFGGLSGSAVKNEKGEVVGLVTLERMFEIEIDISQINQVQQVRAKMISDIILITPIEAIMDLQKFVAETR